MMNNSPSPKTKKYSTLWKAQPHTIAKIQILRYYLFVYFQILGRNPLVPNATMLFIDGFAGPGEYENHSEGSPVAAISAAIESLREAGSSWKAGAIHLAFIEEKQDRVNHLAQVLGVFDTEPEVVSGRIKYRIYKGTFEEKIWEVKKWCPLPFTGRHPLFCFIDPFGATGAPFQLVEELLKTPCSEILLNLDADGIARIIKAKDSEANMRNVAAIFDSPATLDPWYNYLHHQTKSHRLYGEVLDLYKKRLFEQVGARFVFSFEMRTSEAALNYYLVFASKHALGLRKMKEAMRNLDQDGAYRFMDTIHRSGQGMMFRYDEPEDHADILFDEHKGATASYDDLDYWALIKSPFVNPKAMLENLQKRGLVKVHPIPGEKIRKGAFPEKKIKAIEFAPQRNQPFRQT